MYIGPLFPILLFLLVPRPFNVVRPLADARGSVSVLSLNRKGVDLAVKALAQAGKEKPKPIPSSNYPASATVNVVAFDTSGQFLGAPEVSMFESDAHKNIAAKFHDGVGKRIPFGVYRIDAHLVAHYSETRYVRVYQPTVTVIVGLPFGNEAVIIPPRLRGQVVGLPMERHKNNFVKIVGIFSNESIESTISTDGIFEISGLSNGKHILLVLSGGDIVASRSITTPVKDRLLKVNLNADQMISH